MNIFSYMSNKFLLLYNSAKIKKKSIEIFQSYDHKCTANFIMVDSVYHSLYNIFRYLEPFRVWQTDGPMDRQSLSKCCASLCYVTWPKNVNYTKTVFTSQYKANTSNCIYGHAMHASLGHCMTGITISQYPPVSSYIMMHIWLWYSCLLT